MSSYLKHKPNLFLGTSELDRIQKFLGTDGYQKILSKTSAAFGIIKYEADPTFNNFKVVEDVTGSGNYKIANESIAVNRDGKFIVQTPISDQPIPPNGLWYWIRISHLYKSQELGKVSIDINGYLTGTGTEFTKILRGAPSFPSKIKLLNSSYNQLDYEVVEVINDSTVLLAGVTSSFTAETNLNFAVVGTFTPGHIPSSLDKYPFQYDGCSIGVIEETVNNTPPPKADGLDFYIARVKNTGGSLLVHDKRTEIYKSTAEFNLTNILKQQNSLIGIEWAKYNHISTARDTNLLQVGFGMRTAAWTLDAPNRAITFSTGDLQAGKYKSTSQFSDDELNGWRIYLPDGSYLEIYDSEVQGTAIKCTVKEVDPRKLIPGMTLICVPACDQVEIKATPGEDGIVVVERSKIFDASAGYGVMELPVPQDLYKYIVWYRYHKGGETTNWWVLPADFENGYYSEDSFDEDGNLLLVNSRKTYDSDTAEGHIELKRAENAYSNFIETIFTGDKFGYGEFELDNGDVHKLFRVGEDYSVQRCQGVRGGGPMTANHIIGLRTIDAVLGNSFTFIFDVGIQNDGFKLEITSGYMTPTAVGTKIYQFTEEDFDYPFLRQCNVIIKCTFDGTKWVAHVVEKSEERIGDVRMISDVVLSKFPAGRASIGSAETDGYPSRCL